ncbi:hypothetical protein [Sorangium sp. So ce124]|uniref:hypothetical protein n=1 Tax=Sorangium sp. So ce124 TaxID=3133280 RepID=UPI003F5FAD5A
MIPFERTPEPADFDIRVRQPGQRWLAEGAAKRMPDYWRRAARDLQAAFKGLCGYTAMWLSAPGTVDHFVSRDEDPSLAYEWSNFRYATASINSSKSALRSDQVLDPFEVGDGWFEVILPSCQMVLTDRCPPEFRDRAQTMLKRLKLGDGESVVDFRQQWYRMYCEGKLSLEGLAHWAPLLARAVRKQREQAAAEPVASDGAPRSTQAGTSGS